MRNKNLSFSLWTNYKHGPMIKFLISVILFVAPLLSQSQTIGAADVIVYSGVQWSTNGTDWNADLKAHDTAQANVWPTDGGTFTNRSYFFYSCLYSNEGVFLGTFQVIDVKSYYGESPRSMTNLLLNAQFVVQPSQAQFSNITYRPWISISNYLPSTMDTNAYPDNTNTPPHP